ncbi:MAG: phoR6 [Myxococcales bacterium]|nr:phoR6 [Myxococcales bacterium]
MSDTRDQSALELQALQRVIASGARALDLDVVLDRCLEQTLHVTRTEAGLIYLREPERDLYRNALRRGVDPAVSPEIFNATRFDEYLDDRLLVDLAASQLPQGQEMRDAAMALGFTHALILILHVDQRRVGFVALLFRHAPELAESTLHTLDAISAFEAVSIESARVHRQVELRVRLAHTLRDCGERLLDPDVDVPETILTTACRIVRADRGLISRMYEKSPGNVWARIVFAIGKDARLIGIEMPIDAPYLREALGTTGPTVFEDTEKLDDETVVGRTAREQGTRSFILLTMRQRGRPVGHLFAGSGETRAYADAEIEAMQLLSTMAAEALERARRDAERQAEQERIAAIVEDLSVVVAVASRAGEILHINAAGRAFAERMGSLGLNWREAMQMIQVLDRDGKFIPLEERGMVRAFAGQTTRRELTLVSHNGTRMHVLAVSAPLRSPDGTIDAILTSFQDVTELRELADAKDRFLSIASHELRSPITSLRATTSLLQLDPAAVTDETRRATLLARIQRQIDRLSTLVERLLDTTRLNAGELPLDYGDCDMTALCADAVEHARLSDRDRVYTLDDPGPLPGRWDPARIEQVLTNLLNNACRYSATGTEIVVRVRGGDETVAIEVIDQGSGIAADQLDRLFTPFFRGAAAQRHKSGLGLGLYITREIVRRHGGTMRVASKPGEGSTFTVELPRRPKVG